MLFVRNEAEMTLCSTYKTEAKFQRKVQITSWFINYHTSDGRCKLHHKPKIKSPSQSFINNIGYKTLMPTIAWKTISCRVVV